MWGPPGAFGGPCRLRGPLEPAGAPRALWGPLCFFVASEYLWGPLYVFKGTRMIFWGPLGLIIIGGPGAPWGPLSASRGPPCLSYIKA